jgi:hypothetical protein
MNFLGTSLRDLYRERRGKRMRESSYDRTGGNFDFYLLKPNEKKSIFDVSASGCITHIWVTMGTVDQKTGALLERKVVIRMLWDHEESPSVEAPIGDFFGMGHGLSKNFSSAPLSMCPQDGRGYNCYFPMPFDKSARIEIHNESSEIITFYFYVDYEIYDEPIDSELRFHARWRREKTAGIDDAGITNEEYLMGGFNLTGKDNYIIMEAKGKGHYVGCNMNIHNLRFTNKSNWYGEGDDMIFIDDEPWPPRLHGTGTEDYFNTAFSPKQEYNSPYSGIILAGGPNHWGKVTYYRYHIQDPIMFEKSIKVTIEHGHGNRRADDYSSTAYWYQIEPHMDYAPISDVSDRMPLKEVEQLDLIELLKMKNQRDQVAIEMGLVVEDIDFKGYMK